MEIAKWMIAKEICLIVISKYVCTERWNSFENQSIAKNDLWQRHVEPNEKNSHGKMIGKLQSDIYRMVSCVYSWSTPRIEGRRRIVPQTILISYIGRIYSAVNFSWPYLPPYIWTRVHTYQFSNESDTIQSYVGYYTFLFSRNAYALNQYNRIQKEIDSKGIWRISSITSIIINLDARADELWRISLLD